MLESEKMLEIELSTTIERVRLLGTLLFVIDFSTRARIVVATIQHCKHGKEQYQQNYADVVSVNPLHG